MASEPPLEGVAEDRKAGWRQGKTFPSFIKKLKFLLYDSQNIPILNSMNFIFQTQAGLLAKGFQSEDNLKNSNFRLNKE